MLDSYVHSKKCILVHSLLHPNSNFIGLPLVSKIKVKTKWKLCWWHSELSDPGFRQLVLPSSCISAFPFALGAHCTLSVSHPSGTHHTPTDKAASPQSRAPCCRLAPRWKHFWYYGLYLNFWDLYLLGKIYTLHLRCGNMEKLEKDSHGTTAPSSDNCLCHCKLYFMSTHRSLHFCLSFGQR